LTIVEGKEAYPYITEFKKEQFESFALKKRRNIGEFYLHDYKKAVKFYRFFNDNLFSNKSINLENIYWFLLLRKYLKENKEENREEIYKFIKRCEINQDDQIGFNFFPNSKQKYPDIWSTYFALASLKLLGLLKEYLISNGRDIIKRSIKRFILNQKKGNSFLHCKNKDCPICTKTSPSRTLYFVIEIFILLGIDVRINKEQFRHYIGEHKRDPSLIFKILCLKFLDLGNTVKDKEIQYIQEFQRENGGFSFKTKKQIGKINTTFWVVNTLDIYSWLSDYNPVSIYSFTTSNISEILNAKSNLNFIKLMEFSKLIIILSIIWKKFIEEIERFIFRHLEQDGYLNLNLIINNFGLTHGIEEVISYINRYYTFNLRILDNWIEFTNYTRYLSPGRAIIAKEIYNQLSTNSVISISEIYKNYKSQHFGESLKLKEDILPIIKEMMKRNFFKGKILKKGVRKRIFFYLNDFIKKVVVSDTNMNLEQLIQEKEKLRDHKNTIYNMVLKLKEATLKTKEEIDSYLLINETDIAKERIKYLIHNTLLEAEFLNENIEQSFNEELYYINLQEVLSKEITRWKKQYLILRNKLKELEINLQAKIQEKEELRNFKKLLDELENIIFNINDEINKELDTFRKFFREKLEKGYSNENFDLIIKEFNKISQNISKYDNLIYKKSQQITTKEKKINNIHKKIIANWVSIKEEIDSIFDYYINGFQYFKQNLEKINIINETIKNEIKAISDKAQIRINDNKFQDAFEIVRKESDKLLNDKRIEIKELQNDIKKEIKSKRKLYLLYRYLPDKLEELEENIIHLIAKQVQSLKDKIIEERNRSKIEDFDNYVSLEIMRFKNDLKEYIFTLNKSKNHKIQDIINGFDNIIVKFEDSNKIFINKLNDCRKTLENFDEKSNVTIIQW